MKFIFKLALSKTPTNSLKVSSSTLPPPPSPLLPRFLLRKHKHHVTTVGNINQITTYFGRLLSQSFVSQPQRSLLAPSRRLCSEIVYTPDKVENYIYESSLPSILNISLKWKEWKCHIPDRAQETQSDQPLSATSLNQRMAPSHYDKPDVQGYTAHQNVEPESLRLSSSEKQRDRKKLFENVKVTKIKQCVTAAEHSISLCVTLKEDL